MGLGLRLPVDKQYKYNRNRTNWDKSDGLKVHRVLSNMVVSRYIYSVTIWDLDNFLTDKYTGSSGSGFISASINKELRRLNSKKCRKINGYNGKLNGRE